MVNLDVIQILDNSSIILGHFNDQLRSAKKGAPPSFLTLNLLYIDLLKQITKTESILNEKYCDIDP